MNSTGEDDEALVEELGDGVLDALAALAAVLYAAVGHVVGAEKLYGPRSSALVLSASTSRPPHRPNTADTFWLWLRCVQPRIAQRVLIVTSQVFVPFETFDAIRQLYLPRGVHLDVVGFGPEWGEPPKTTEYLLQETLSGLRSASRLVSAAGGPGTSISNLT